MRELDEREIGLVGGAGDSLAYEAGEAYGNYVATAENNFVAWAAMTLRSYLQS